MCSKSYSLILLSILAGILFVSGCTGLDPTAIARTSPVIQQFLNEHPNAQIRITHFSATESSSVIDQIRKDCDNQNIQEKEFYRVNITDPVSNFYAVAWIDASTNSIECALKFGTEGNQSQTCTQASDCYPPGFTPGECGTFYTCSDGKCHEGSAACPPSNQNTCYPDKLCIIQEGQSATIAIGGINHTLQTIQVSPTNAVIAVDGLTQSVTMGQTKDINGVSVFTNNISYFGIQTQGNSVSLMVTPPKCYEGQGCAIEEGKIASITTSTGIHTLKTIGVPSPTQALISVDGIAAVVVAGNTTTIAGLEIYTDAIYFYGKEQQISQITLTISSPS